MLIVRRPVLPDLVARHPRRVPGGWVYTFRPPRRYWGRILPGDAWTLPGILASVAAVLGGGPACLAGLDAVTTPYLLPWQMSRGTFSVNGNIIPDSVGDGFAVTARMTRDATIRSFGLLVTSTSGSPTADFSVEVPGTNGLPQSPAVLWGTDTRKTGVSLSAGFVSSGALDADAVCAAGDVVSFVVRLASGTNFVVNTLAGPPESNFADLRPCLNTTGSWTRANTALNGTPRMILFAPDGSVIRPGVGFSSMSGLALGSFSTAVSPNHRGNRMTTAQRMTCRGIWTMTAIPSAADLILADDTWDGTNGGALGRIVIADGQDSSSDALRLWEFSSPVALETGTLIRAIVKATSSSAGSAALHYYDVSDASHLNALSGGADLHYTTANNPTGSGSWTSTTTRRAYIGWWFDVPAGVGGLRAAGHGGLAA